VWAAQRILDTGVPLFPSGDFYSHGLLFTYLVALFRALGGNAEWIARLPSVLIGVATILTLYKVGEQLFSPPVGLLAAAYLAVDPIAITWGGRARMYALLQFLVLLAVFAFYRGMSKNKSSREEARWRYIGALFLVAAFFTQPESILLVPAVALAMLLLRGLRWCLRPHVIGPFVVMGGGAVAVYTVNKLGQAGLLETIQQKRPFLFSGRLVYGLEAFQPFFVSPWRVLLTIGLLAGLLIILYRRKLSHDEQGDALSYLVVLFVSTMFVLVFLVGQTWKNPRYAFMLLPLFVLIAAEAARLGGSVLTRSYPLARKTYPLGVFFIALAVLVTGWSTTYAQVEGYDLAFRYVREHWEPGDAIASPVPPAAMLYLGQNDYFAIQRAYREYVMRHDGREVDRWSDAPLLTTVSDLKQALRRHRRLWFVVDGWRFETRYNIQFAQLILDQMKVAYTEQGTVVFLARGYTPPTPPVTTRNPNANFAGELRLATFWHSRSRSAVAGLASMAGHGSR